MNIVAQTDKYGTELVDIIDVDGDNATVTVIPRITSHSERYPPYIVPTSQVYINAVIR